MSRAGQATGACAPFHHLTPGPRVPPRLCDAVEATEARASAPLLCCIWTAKLPPGDGGRQPDERGGKTVRHLRALLQDHGDRGAEKAQGQLVPKFTRSQGYASIRPPQILPGLHLFWLLDPAMGPEWKSDKCKMVPDAREDWLVVHVDPAGQSRWRVTRRPFIPK